MFGDKSSSTAPVVKDSRELKILAKLVTKSNAVRLLRRGKSVLDVAQETRPVGERLKDVLHDTIEGLKTAQGLLGGEVTCETAQEVLSAGRDISTRGKNLLKRIMEIRNTDIEND